MSIKHTLKKLYHLDVCIPPLLNLEKPLKFTKGRNIGIGYLNDTPSIKMEANFFDARVEIIWDGKWYITILGKKHKPLVYYTKYWNLPKDVQKIISWMSEKILEEYEKRRILTSVEQMTSQIRAYKKDGSLRTILDAIEEQTKEEKQDEFSALMDNVTEMVSQV